MADIASMLTAFGSSIDPLQKMVTGFAYVLGFFFVVMSLKKLSIYGKTRSMSPGQGNPMGALAFFFVGALFIYLPTALSTFLMTIYGIDSPLAYTNWQEGLVAQYGDFKNIIIRLVQLAGLVWFIKGWSMIAFSMKPGRSEGAKGLAYMIGGLIGLNVIGTMNLLSDGVNTLNNFWV